MAAAAGVIAGNRRLAPHALSPTTPPPLRTSFSAAWRLRITQAVHTPAALLSLLALLSALAPPTLVVQATVGAATALLLLGVVLGEVTGLGPGESVEWGEARRPPRA